jgi:Transposase
LTNPDDEAPVTSIDKARTDVQQATRALLTIVDCREPMTAAIAEQRLWSGLLALGRALMAMFFVRQARRWRVGGAYDVDGRSFAVVGTESSEVGTRFGKVVLEQPVGMRTDDLRAARDLPLQRGLGLPAGFTMLVVTTMARLCAQMAFASARELAQHLFEWAPSPRAVLRMVDAVGERARGFLEQAPAPDEDGEVLVITVDAKGAPAISSTEYARRARPHGARKANRRHGRRQKRRERPRVRRGPGKKSKNAKMAAVGVLYTLRRDPEGKLDGPVNKRVYATFNGYRALFEWIAQEAKKRGYGTAKFTKVLFVADGADAIWNLQQEFFPDADVCLDWYHVVEKLWASGKAICRGTRRQRAALEAWVAAQKKRLRQGKTDEVIAAIDDALSNTAVTGPGNKYRREVLTEVRNHLVKNKTRMQYAQLRRADLDIGSGVVEGAVRHLVGVRLDGPGMRWGRDRAEAILHLRCVLINGLWHDFTQHLMAQADFRLRSQPVPTRTHDAVLKQAA